MKQSEIREDKVYRRKEYPWVRRVESIADDGFVEYTEYFQPVREGVKDEAFRRGCLLVSFAGWATAVLTTAEAAQYPSQPDPYLGHLRKMWEEDRLRRRGASKRA